MDNKEALRLSPNEANMVLSSLGYKNFSRMSKEWRGDAKCHGGNDDHNFSFLYSKGVAQCWSAGCFGEGTDIYGVVEHETGKNFFESKRHVEEIINRELDDDFSGEVRSSTYYDNLIGHIKKANEEAIEDNKKTRWLSDKAWKIYADSYHPYWSERGFSKDTLEYFGAGYNEENNRITVPIFDLKSDGTSSVVAMKQRIASDDSKLIVEGNPKYLHDSYEAGKVLFNLNNAVNIIKNTKMLEFLDFKGIIIVEGNLDVMMGHQLGQPNIVCTGSNFLTKDQAMLLELYTDQILIIPDEDAKWNEIKGEIEWRGGRLIQSAVELLGKTMTIYVGRVGGIKDIGSLNGEYSNLILSEVVRNSKKIKKWS